MGFLEILSNLLNLTTSTNLFKIHFEKFTDKNEYLGERIKSFISFTILTLCFIALVLGIAFLIYKLLKRP